ncbi:hypothetical protein AAFF_G00273080 [Aldrovandia affinis]|uniref:Uncharacterized protein n=1 Tax=Aldrovandia affinis TaxID=143900 RepID=A0AAD7STD4_9TELE|nr:hypothetical protein AAFF_G00273080 [Aldrovandia affinis]
MHHALESMIQQQSHVLWSYKKRTRQYYENQKLDSCEMTSPQALCCNGCTSTAISAASSSLHMIGDRS